MKSIIILLIMVGIIFIAVGYVKANQMCPPPVIQYRYYPKTFKQEQEEPVAVSVLYGNMFKDKSPWYPN